MTATAAPAAPATRVTRLPEATREAQMERWGITPDRTGDSAARRVPYRNLENGAAPPRRVRRADDADQRGFLIEGGWSVATILDGGGRAHGLTTHRGVLHPDEYVDAAALAGAVADRLGCTLDEVRAVYRQGPLSGPARELRAWIDARLLEVESEGGVMLELGRALGWSVNENGNCRTMDNALARAREAAR